MDTLVDDEWRPVLSRVRALIDRGWRSGPLTPGDRAQLDQLAAGLGHLRRVVADAA